MLSARSLGAELRAVQDALEQVALGRHHRGVHDERQYGYNDDADPDQIDVHDLTRIEDHASDAELGSDKFADDRARQRQADIDPQAADDPGHGPRYDDLGKHLEAARAQREQQRL